MNRLKLDRPSLSALLPTPELKAAFDEKSAAFEAGRFVRDLRQRMGLTQQELADGLGVTQARVSAIENGAGADGPTYGLIKRVVTACGAEWNPYLAVVQATAVPQPLGAGTTPQETRSTAVQRVVQAET